MYGKFHSSNSEENGIIYSAIRYLSDKIIMCAAFIEYYDGKWYDLSILNGKHLGKPNQCTNLQLNSMEDLSSIIKIGLSNRKTAKTNQNNHSSRSHALLVISSPRHTGQIVFVDMAGNECADGKENINETCFINKSISQLNKVLYSK